MSKAVICDRCKKAVAEQNAMHIETKKAFIISHYDLCPACINAFRDYIMGGDVTAIKEDTQ